jgi:hypothetical protein
MSGGSEPEAKEADNVKAAGVARGKTSDAGQCEVKDRMRRLRVSIVVSHGVLDDGSLRDR